MIPYSVQADLLRNAKARTSAQSIRPEIPSWDELSGRNDPAQRFRIYCRDHAGNLSLIATCGTPEAVGVAIITLGREHEFEDCALGILDVLGEKGERWVLRPWEASAKNVSDAGRTLRTARKDYESGGTDA